MENSVLLQSFVTFAAIIACSRVDLSHDLIETLKVMKLLTTKMQAGTSPQNITTSGCLFISGPQVTFNITSGKVYGLIAPGLEIRGYCSAPGWIGSEVTIGCYGFFNSVRAHFNGAAIVNSSRHDVNFIATPAGSVDVLVELAAEPGNILHAYIKASILFACLQTWP
nr:uncharacterized protein LOC129386000 [Dermacentor andersoni]